MERLFRIFRRNKSPIKKYVDMIDYDGQPAFDTKYKTIVKRSYKPGWVQMLEWVNSNSNGLVAVKFNNRYGYEAIYIGFEDLDDALFFKIKYSI